MMQSKTTIRSIILFLLLNVTAFSLKAQQDSIYTSLTGALQNPSQVYLLDLREHGLTGLPASIGTLTNLRRLLIGSNQLTALPPEIGQLTQLVALVANDNSIASLPNEIGQLANLEWMDLRNNQISDLPVISSLSGLQTLLLSGNSQLSDLSQSLTSLPLLQEVRLAGCNISFATQGALMSALPNVYFFFN